MISMGLTVLEHAADTAGSVPASVPQGRFDMPTPGQGLDFEVDLGDAAANILVLPALGLAGSDRELAADLADELLVRLVHAENGPGGVVWSAVDLKDVFHAGYERGVLSGWDAPLLLAVRLRFVFSRKAVASNCSDRTFLQDSPTTWRVLPAPPRTPVR